MFQLTKDEIPEDFSKSQIATLNENGNKRGLHIKKLPYAFTEQGIYMLATVLKGKLAEQQSVFIMRMFRKMRHYIKQNQIYHCSASSKDEGKKLCAINDIFESSMIHPVIDKLLSAADKQI